jgi:cyclic pyranopterin phosphate synthase
MSKKGNKAEHGSARMVDVSDKAVTTRTASAEGFVRVSPDTMRMIEEGALPKGDVFDVARVAGMMAAKRTADLLPMCHPIVLDDIGVEIEKVGGDSLKIRAGVKAEAKTGAEMEALVAVSVAALTVYDMCKGVDRGIRLTDIRVVRKSGGRSGDWVAEDD